MGGVWAIGLLDPAGLAMIGHASWISLPRPAFLQVAFDCGLLPAFLAAGIAAALRAVGVLTTCQRINNAAWRRPDRVNIRKGVLADGLSNLVGGSGWLTARLYRLIHDLGRHASHAVAAR